LPEDLRRRVLVCFAGEVRKKAQSLENLHEVASDPDASCEEPASILPFVMAHPDGALFTPTETADVHARLRRPCEAASVENAALLQIFHLGQPVAVGPKTALRVCASAPIVSEIAERVREGESLEAAFAQWGRHLDALFEKWRRLMDEASAERDAAQAAQRDHEPAI
jgi:hypothetical protein